jgi:lipoprotein NlpI/transglutaminase-like putative cysteine protease
VFVAALALVLGLAPVARAQTGAAPSPKPAAAQRAAKPKAAPAPTSATPAATATQIKDEKSGFVYTVEPAPTWVVPASEAPNVAVDRAAMHYRVIDEQVRVEDRSAAVYSHVVRVVDEAAGLPVASQIELEFDPSYQTMALHHLDILRNGQRLNRLDRKRIQLLQRETQLERSLYDGRVTLSVIVDDVRSDDQIDFAYTVRGANPVFGGKFVHTGWMISYRGPVATYQLRLLAPAGRSIQARVGPADAQVASTVAGAWRETLIRRESVPQVSAEPGAPYSALLVQQVLFSEFSDWAEVARWGQALFNNGAAQAGVERKAAEIRAGTGDRSAQLLAALDFVQKEVRYFGTEVGTSSHLPAAPDRVLEQRFGDCKDKVALLVALLHQLDIPATPVLVSTTLRRQVELTQPTPVVFDHVIARVDLDGTTYWLDATRGHQTGPLAARQAVGFGAGLPLADGTQALAVLPAAFDTVRATFSDRVHFERFAADPVLESRITYRGDLAEMYREALATRSLQDLAPDLAAPYLRIYPKIRSTAPLRVEPATDDDAITFVQAFVVPEFWRFPEQRNLVADFAHWGALQALVVPRSQVRKEPLAFAFPGIFRQTFHIDFPEDVFREGGSQKFEDSEAGVSLKVALEGTKNSLESVAEVRFATEQIVPSDWPAYSAKLNKVLPRLAGTVSVSAIPLDRLPAVGAELKAQEDAVRAKRVKASTRVQTEALFKIIALSAQIAGGRLPPPLEAQALNARGVQYDQLGQPERAEPDFTRALALAPDVAEIETAAAVNAVQRREFDRAIELTSQVLKASPNDSEALNTRALARYFKPELGAAEADLTELLKAQSAVRRGYPIVWLSLAMRQDGRGPATLATTYPKDQLPTGWPRPLVDMALGQASVDAVISAAQSEKNPAESLCEAYFYIAEKYRAEGDAGRAAMYWRKSVDQGVVEFIEDAASRLRLATANK